MFLDSGVNYYIIPFNNRVVYTQSGLIIKNPTIKVKLLSLSEYTKINTLKNAKERDSVINEEIFNSCYLGLLGFEEEVLNAEDSGFLVDTVANYVLQESSKRFLEPAKEVEEYEKVLTKPEIWSGYISNILNIPYDQVILKPIDELIRLYTICFIVAGGTIPNIDLKPRTEEG